MVDVAEGANDFAAKAAALSADANGDFNSKITVEAEYRNTEWHIRRQIAIKLYVTISANTANNPMADAGIFPEWVAKFSNLFMSNSFGTATPIQAVPVGNTAIAFLNC